jgi:hypothetical protein
MSTLWLLSVVSSALPLTLRAARSKKFPSIADSSRSPGERSGVIEVPLPAVTRRLLVLPNGDVLVAEQSAGYVTLLRDDGDWYGRRRGRPRPRAARNLTTTRLRMRVMTRSLKRKKPNGVLPFVVHSKRRMQMVAPHPFP